MFQAPPNERLVSRGWFLESELRRELEGARTAGAKHARRSRGWTVINVPDVYRSCSFVCEGDCCRVDQVGKVEQVEDLADQVELDSFVEADCFGDSQVLG